MRSIRSISTRLIFTGVALIAVVVVAAVLLARSGDSPTSSSNSAAKGQSSPSTDPSVKKADTMITPGAEIEVVNAAGRHTASRLHQGESISTTITGFPANRKGMQSFIGECAVPRAEVVVCAVNEISRFVPDQNGTGRADVVVHRTFAGTTDQGTNVGTIDCAKVSGGCFLVALAVEPNGGDVSNP